MATAVKLTRGDSVKLNLDGRVYSGTVEIPGKKTLVTLGRRDLGGSILGAIWVPREALAAA